jgi:asparagine synthase (glutamine-hydrolysing)
MCGIAGYLTVERNGPPVDARTLEAMGLRLAHRGPDDHGVWFDQEAGIGLAHRRLSIIDLSPAGHQPMQSPSGRWVIAFNGEIYNHSEIRQQLDATSIPAPAGSTLTQGWECRPAWRGTSDTETLLAGFDTWGIDETLRKVKGMFAFAVWDRKRRELILARDRIGQKPLYYGWQGETFLFGSELNALRAHPAFRSAIDRNSIALLMRYGCIPAPHSIYSGISKLVPGALLSVRAGDRSQELGQYWNADDVITAGRENPWHGTDHECVEILERLLVGAVRQQMVADVPLGAFLSGGVDSSAVVSLMQAQSSRPIRTFTIGFSETNYDEAPYARSVARHLGTDHTELRATPEQALAVIEKLPVMYCEPFADSSQIPTFLVSQLTRDHVTVALSGDGGDELFGGYNRYLFADRLWNRSSRLPAWLRRLIGAAATSIPPNVYDGAARPLRDVLPKALVRPNLGDIIHKAGRALGARTIDELYLHLVSQWSEPASVVIGAEKDRTGPPETGMRRHALDTAQEMMARDLLHYLPDDVLCKVDRAAMAVGLETRVPMLDEDVVEFAWRMPFRAKIRDGMSKWALRQVLYKYVPAELIERPKSGFAIPIDEWLRGPLRDWAESLIGASRLEQEGYLRPGPIRQKWDEHLSRKRNWQSQLWTVLMFQCWLHREARLPAQNYLWSLRAPDLAPADTN